MASYHDPYDYDYDYDYDYYEHDYDSRTRPTRPARQNDFHSDTIPPRDGNYSTAGYGDTYRSNSNSNSNSNSMSRNRLAADRYGESRYDPRFHYSSSVPSKAAPPSRAPHKRRSWPPPPCAEDAVVSLRRESNSQDLLQEEVARDEAPARGTVDQEPLIQDTELVNMYERRFVLAESDRPAGMPTPPTSEDEKARRVRRMPSKLGINCVPGVAKRTSSPYAFSKNNDASGDRFLSPASTTSPSAQSTRMGNVGVQPPSPRRDSVRDSGRLTPSSRRGHAYFSAVEDHAIALDDTDDSGQHHVSGKRVIDAPLTSSPSSTSFDFSSPQVRRANLDSRRYTDTQNTLPTMARLNMEKTRRLTPLMSSTSLHEAQDATPIQSSSWNPQSVDPHHSTWEHSHSSSRGTSPVGSAGRRDTTRPSRMGSEYSQEGSKPPSTGTSRPGTPPRSLKESPRLPKTDLDWSALLAANAARRTKPPSRLASSVPQDPVSDMPRRRTQEGSSRQPSSSLPYPEDTSLMGSTLLMPHESDHAHYPSKQASSSPPFSFDSNPGSFVGTSSDSSKPSYTSFLPNRPPLARGYSASPSSDTRPSDSKPRQSEANRELFASSSQTKKDLAVLMKKGLPPCPRTEPVAGFDDWYTVIGATNIDFCPECIATLFEKTFFRPSFRRSLPRNPDNKVRCAFGSPWIRLAWLLTLQQQRVDLGLLKDVADIENTTSPCPGSVQTAQSWYGLRDDEGLFVRDFHLCYCHVRLIERLLPTLSGLFVRLPHRASFEKRVCAIRTESNRFSAYLDAMVNTHENALSSRKGADGLPLIDLIEQKTRLRECTRDNMLIGGLWHYAPDIPSFTICEDCFEELVEPQIKKNMPLTRIFNRTVQPVYGEGIGSSCQLYSGRMRKIFQRSVDDNDFSYLARKSKERREAELWLQEKYKEVMRKAKRLSLEGAVSDEDEKRLSRELERISTIWRSEWE